MDVWLQAARRGRGRRRENVPVFLSLLCTSPWRMSHVNVCNVGDSKEATEPGKHVLIKEKSL